MCQVTRHNSTSAPAVSLRQTTRGRVGLEQLRKPARISVSNLSFSTIMSLSYLGQHLSLVSRSLVSPTPPPDPLDSTTLRTQELRRGLGIPIHSSRMIDRAAARRKGSCEGRKKERSVYPCPLCAFNYHPSCLPQPCPHNRVLTGAVSRQH